MIARRRFPAPLHGFAGGLALVLCLIAPAAFAQIAAPVLPREPPPSPERVYPGAVDRPLQPPEVLRDDRIDPDAGVQIGLGVHSTAVHYPRLKVSDDATANASEGVVISANVLMGDLRLGYSRQFYRRILPAGTQVKGQPVNFLAIDTDQFWAMLGWRPSYRLFLGAGAGLGYRLIRVRQDATDRITETQTLGMGALMAELLIATPFSLQLRVVREDSRRNLYLDSSVLQLAYQIPF